MKTNEIGFGLKYSRNGRTIIGYDNNLHSKLIIPDGVEEIADNAFNGCDSMTEICISKSVKYIKYLAFHNCSNLRIINIKNDKIKIDFSSFVGCGNIDTIIMPHFNKNFLFTCFLECKKLRTIVEGEDGFQYERNVFDVFLSQAQEFKLMSLFYHNFGLNLTMVQGYHNYYFSYKEPVSWKDGMILEELFYSKQKDSDILRQDWIHASGIGMALGWGCYRAIDIDDILKPEQMDAIVSSLLNTLGLPEDYEWIIKTGSQRGIHIIIRVEDFGDKYTHDRITYAYTSLNQQFERIEFRWRDHLMLPPSIHYSANSYVFYNNRIPTADAKFIQLKSIDLLLDNCCGDNYFKRYEWNDRDFVLVERRKVISVSSDQNHTVNQNEGDSYRWLISSGTPQSYNSLAIRYTIGQGVPVNPEQAFRYFQLANNDQSNFNIASLMSVGFFDGTLDDIEHYLEIINWNNLHYHNETAPYSISLEEYISEIRNQAKEYLSADSHFCNALIYSEDGRTIINCDKSFEGDLVVPKGVEHIAERAFVGCSKITTIRISDSVKTIGEEAFFGCEGLISIHISESVTNIGDRAFRCCRGLTSITVDSNNYIYDSRESCNAIIITSSNRLLVGCQNTIIPSSVTSIGDCAFFSCTNLSSIKIPDSVTSIGDMSFYDCSGLTFIQIPDTVTRIGVGAFSSCCGLTSIRIPDCITQISGSVFDGCSGLTSVNIPDGVISIGNSAFYNCGSLTSIRIPDSVITIGNRAFEYCCGLTFIQIPDSVTSIGDKAFSGCSGLKSIQIPDSVTNIGYSALDYCKALTSIIIPVGTRMKFRSLLPEYELRDKFLEKQQTKIERKGQSCCNLFFDTETTGVPRNYNAPSSNIQNWPRLVQLAWILTDENGNRIHSDNLIIRPDGFTIPKDASKVHGITTEIAMKEGIPLDKAINQFIEDFNSARYIVGHNVDFDKKIVGAEMIRLGMKDIMDSKKSYCTMQSSIDFCKIPGKYGYKYPKLQELYKKLFGCEFDNAHDAMSDIEATEKCFWELRKRKLI